MTQCTQGEFEFTGGGGGRRVVAAFDSAPVSSNGGVLLLREADHRIGLIEALSGCFRDGRDPDLIEHTVRQLVAQRIYGLALGYEDLNDHEELRADALLGLVSGKAKPGQELLAGKSTLNRLELSVDTADRYKRVVYESEKLDAVYIQMFLKAYEAPARRIVIDLDTTDVALHGGQEGRFFHGYYDTYCYLPLYVFCGEHLLGVRLREANQDGAAGAEVELARIIGQIRQAWPKTHIVVRGDSGFCREALMNWCEANAVDYVFGLARNERLRAKIRKPMRKAMVRAKRTGQACREFTEFRYRTRDSWRRARRVVAKSEYLPGKENPRFVVTSLTRERYAAKRLYEELYCARGEMENCIKEQLSLFADRVSSATMRANQLRMYLSGFAYTLFMAFRRFALAGTEFARAQVNTLRLKLLKIGALVKTSVRRIVVSLSSAHPNQGLFALAHQRLRL
jgi:hypothetical protein